VKKKHEISRFHFRIA